jgi:cyclophilin family peptidyl-prolyl cis-trans isomerase
MLFPMQRWFFPVLIFASLLRASAAPVIDPLSNISIPAGKSLIIPVTATSPNRHLLTFTATSSTNRITVQVHAKNPFWKMSVAQVASAAAPAAYQTPFRGGVVTATNMGDMTFMLFRDIAPHTVDVIQGLTASGLYTSNTIFHRVIAGFMNQGGDPLTNGMGGPVFRYDDEWNPKAIFSGSGQLALANSGKDTDGSQFFITVAPYRFGDFGYTIFGQLVRGFNVLSNINNTPTDANDRPLADVIITKASFVPDNFDTVLTLTGTNLAGVAGTIKVIADDGTGGRATNSFTATTISDTGNDDPAFLKNPVFTNLYLGGGIRVTNYIQAQDLEGNPLYYYVLYGDTNTAANATNGAYYANGGLAFSIVPGYTGPLSFKVYVSDSSGFATYDQQLVTFAVGDTPVSANATNFVAPPLTPFTNQLLTMFTNGVPNSSPTNFTAFINWGDNSTNSGSITTNTLGIKEVLGSHIYTNSGDYPIYITIQSVLGASSTVVCTSTVPPSVSLTRSGTANTIGWPAWAFSYQLLSNTNLGTMNWAAVTNISALVGYENVVTNSTVNPDLFFRLRR